VRAPGLQSGAGNGEEGKIMLGQNDLKEGAGWQEN